ncbi:MAG: GGDEF domain-containing protein, partial [Nitrospirota bacterium]
SIHDNLTKIYNRKAYDTKIEETLADMNRYNISSSILLCDIDHVKRINDSFGHYIGDLTLKKVAHIFRNKLRKNDFVARYGGEEFICILPHTGLEDARKAAEEICSFINNAVFTFKGKEVSITTSIGVSTLRKEDNALSVFERADVALYMAKASGRNLVKTEHDVEKAGETFSNSIIDTDDDNDNFNK